MSEIIDIVKQEFKENEIIRQKMSIGSYSELGIKAYLKITIVILVLLASLFVIDHYSPNGLNKNTNDSGISTFLFYTPRQ